MKHRHVDGGKEIVVLIEIRPGNVRTKHLQRVSPVDALSREAMAGTVKVTLFLAPCLSSWYNPKLFGLWRYVGGL